MAKKTKKKKTSMMITELQKKGFEAIDEFISVYDIDKKVFTQMSERIMNNIQEGRPPFTGMYKEEKDLYGKLSADLKNSLLRLMGYLYPKLKALEIDTGSQQPVVFNISGIPNLNTKENNE